MDDATEGRTNLSLLIESQSEGVEVFKDLLRRGVLAKLAVGVEGHHVGRAQRRGAPEKLVKSFLFSLSHAFLRHGHYEVDSGARMVLFVILHASAVSNRNTGRVKRSLP